MVEPIRQFDINRHGRDYVVGDLHGHFPVLEALLGHVDFDETRDRLFSVGDLVDGGPESACVAEFLDRPWFFSIRGNHEQMLLQGADGPAPHRPAMPQEIMLWLRNGGDWWNDIARDAQLRIYQAVEQLPIAIEVTLADGARAALVHAQTVDGDWPVSRAWLMGDQSADGWPLARDVMLWGRSDAMGVYDLLRSHAERVPEDLHVEGIDMICHGHTPMPQGPVRVANTRWLDTGVSQGRNLTLAELAVDGQVWSMSTDCLSITEGWTTP